MNNHPSLPKDSLLEHVGSMDQLGGVRRFHLSEGKGKGVEAIHVETGSGFTFAILVDSSFQRVIEPTPRGMEDCVRGRFFLNGRPPVLS